MGDLLESIFAASELVGALRNAQSALAQFRDAYARLRADAGDALSDAEIAELDRLAAQSRPGA